MPFCNQNKHLMMLYHAIKGFRVFMAPLNLIVSFSVFGLSVLNTALTSANVYSLDYLILCTEENQSKKKIIYKKTFLLLFQILIAKMMKENHQYIMGLVKYELWSIKITHVIFITT